MAHISAGSRFSDLPPELRRASAGSNGSRPPTNHLLQDHHQQQAQSQEGSQSLLSKTASWAPNFLFAFRFLTITRLIAARYVIFPDCDETFNYWESLHLLIYPPLTSVIPGLLPFQTWEYAPQFAIRSYAYLLPYLGVAKIGQTFMPLMSKLDTLFLIRNVLALLSSAVEAKFCTAVSDTIHPRVGKYLFFLLLTNAGMSAASTALLPSTFTMYTTTLALAYAFYPSRLPSPNSVPAPSNLSLTNTPYGRSLIATATFAVGALLGWPFAIVLSLPFVVEEVLMPSGNSVPASVAKIISFVQARLVRFVGYALLSGVVIGGATVLVDSLAYGKVTFVPLGIVIYNVLSSRRGAGPELYGVEPPTYYLANLALSFNILLPLALLSAPLALLTAFLVDPTRFDPPSRTFPLTSSTSDAKDKKSGLLSSSRFALLSFRLAPFYLWLALLTSQPHKEERFMFPAYPLLCFNAAVSVYFVRVLAEAILRVLSGPYNKAQTKTTPLHVTLPSALTTSLIVLTSVLSVLRTFHTHASFYAPTAVLEHFSHREMPRVVARLFPTTLTSTAQKRRLASGLEAFPNDDEERANHPEVGGSLPSWLSLTDEPPALPSLTGLVDISLLQSHFKGSSQSPHPIRLCYGKEWHRFPSHFYVPQGVQVDFVKSEFDGILPKHYSQQARTAEAAPTDKVVSLLDGVVGWLWPWKDVTRTRQGGFNDMNREEVDRYVNIDTCDYLVDLDHPHRYASGASSVSALEPRHAVDSAKWTRVHCVPFLDTDASREALASSQAGSGPARIASKVLTVLDRTLFIPGPVRRTASTVLGWQSSKKYGDYCLLRTTRKESWANAKGPIGP